MTDLNPTFRPCCGALWEDEHKPGCDEPREKFIEELSELSRRHGFKLWGCGCCNSPSVDPIEPEERDGHYEYDSETLEWVKS